MNQSDYIKQLEESNRQLQDKLEASEKNHDDYIDKPIYIYVDGTIESSYDVSFEDRNGNVGSVRIVSTLRYYQETPDNRPISFGRHVYQQTWMQPYETGEFKWVTDSQLNISISSCQVKSSKRKLKMTWTSEAFDDLKSMGKGNLGAIDVSNIGGMLNEEVDKFMKPIKKPTAKQIKKYGNKKHVK